MAEVVNPVKTLVEFTNRVADATMLAAVMLNEHALVPAVMLIAAGLTDIYFVC